MKIYIHIYIYIYYIVVICNYINNTNDIQYIIYNIFTFMSLVVLCVYVFIYIKTNVKKGPSNDVTC